jgi:hypothetical protein
MRRAMRRPIPMSFSRTPLEMQKSARHRGRQKVAGRAGQVIWQIADSTDSTGMVTVRRKALAVILPIVDIGLAHRRRRDLSPTWKAIEADDPADP